MVIFAPGLLLKVIWLFKIAGLVNSSNLLRIRSQITALSPRRLRGFYRERILPRRNSGICGSWLRAFGALGLLQLVSRLYSRRCSRAGRSALVLSCILIGVVYGMLRVQLGGKRSVRKKMLPFCIDSSVKRSLMMLNLRILMSLAQPCWV